MEQLRISRDLKLRNIEIFRITEGHLELPISYMLLIDLKRSNTLEYFEYLEDVEDKDDFGRNNSVKVIYISNKELQKSSKEELLSIAEGFLDNKDECWDARFKTIDDNLFEYISHSLKTELEYIQTILEEFNIDINIDLLNTCENKLNLLSQN
ncbi:hypothetical protein [Clostridium psychrophilum]|uniref:hypothetical protein n=1 Tax=Clostridium psychrophilum TaxID=132926 RepID=UPI001C0D1B48|nr:hypothetical protein [Clostridium psychrophilum]MBU3180490.1 hypothetical protein [Clostridium psychrophilum]